MSFSFKLYDYNEAHGDQYGKQVSFDYQTNKWMIGSNVAKYQLPLPRLFTLVDNLMYLENKKVIVTTTPPTTTKDPDGFVDSVKTFVSKDKKQRYSKAEKSNWQGMDRDETHPEVNLEQSWNPKELQWETNGSPSTYQMAPPPGFKLKDTSPQVPITPTVKTSPAPKAGVQSVISNSTKPKPVPVTPPKEIPSQYDLLFNSLNYLSVNEAEIEKMSMDLIFSGDDILTDFNYRSIDYLPDFEIEVKDKYGDFVDASSIFDQTEKNDTTITTIYRGKVDKTVKTLDPIMDSLHKLLKDSLQNQPYAKVSKYLGTVNKSGFSPGISRGQTVDFYFLLPKKYHKYEIKLDFNPI